eukprot:GHUV01045398.1.p1 GENE.GHUV01045398.1~~GHUV01045398.1.p1  ORF type:complete len:134 (+),score=27.02 GHUV01045398.1:284-685(+)
MFVTQGCIPHVCYPNTPLAAAVCKDIAMLRVKLSRRDDLQKQQTMVSATILIGQSPASRQSMPCCYSKLKQQQEQLHNDSHTSVRSSMFAGLMSTILKLWSVTSRLHRLTRKSSAERNVCWSLLTLMLLMWYV